MNSSPVSHPARRPSPPNSQLPSIRDVKNCAVVERPPLPGPDCPGCNPGSVKDPPSLNQAEVSSCVTCWSVYTNWTKTGVDTGVHVVAVQAKCGVNVSPGM